MWIEEVQSASVVLKSVRSEPINQVDNENWQGNLAEVQNIVTNNLRFNIWTQRIDYRDALVLSYTMWKKGIFIIEIDTGNKNVEILKVNKEWKSKRFSAYMTFKLFIKAYKDGTLLTKEWLIY